MFLRFSSKNLLSDAVHEGTHVLDYLKKTNPVMGTISLEKKAYFYERQFQKANGTGVTFETTSEMLNHIKTNYP